MGPTLVRTTTRMVMRRRISTKPLTLSPPLSQHNLSTSKTKTSFSAIYTMFVMSSISDYKGHDAVSI